MSLLLFSFVVHGNEIVTITAHNSMSSGNTNKNTIGATAKMTSNTSVNNHLLNVCALCFGSSNFCVAEGGSGHDAYLGRPQFVSGKPWDWRWRPAVPMGLAFNLDYSERTLPLYGPGGAIAAPHACGVLQDLL